MSSFRPRSVRRAIAAALVALPGIAIPLIWLQWRSELPETLPVQWSGNEVTTSMPTAVVLVITLLVALGATVWAVTAAITGSPSDAPRAPYLAGGSAAATATMLWIISGGLAAGAFGATETPVGLLGSAVFAALLWGFVPFLVAGRSPDYAPAPAAEIGAIR